MKRRILPLALALLLALTCALPAAAETINDYPNVIMSTFNTASVQNGPEYFPVIVVNDQDVLIQAVTTYHWNNGRGATPGTISIYDWDDNCLGTWQATGRGGSGASNVNWDIFPNFVMKAGEKYYFVDSDFDTWSCNSASDYVGFVEVRGAAYGSTPPSRQTAAVEVTVNGSYVQWTDAWPFIDENSRTMVPLRAVADAMGLSVGWDPVAREASFTDGSRAIYFPIGSTVARAGLGGQIPMDTAAVIVNDRTYAPIRYLAQFFGFNVDWDGETKTVIITGSVTPGWNPVQDSGYSFAAMDINIDVDDHGTQTYRTVRDSGGYQTCYATVGSYRVFYDDDAFPGFAGYEWRVMTIDVATPGGDGTDRHWVIDSNYYDMLQHESSMTIDSDGVAHYSVDWNGQTAQYSLWWRTENVTDEGFRITFTAQVPTGYDGLVVGLMNNDYADMLSENYLFQIYSGPQDFALFRMK